MRSLAFKLTLAFLLVGLTGAVLEAVIVRYRTRSAFSQFILNREQQVLVENLLEYYRARGNWEGVEDYLQVPVSTLPRFLDNRWDLHRNWARFILVGPDRTVVVSNLPEQIGRQILARELDEAIPLKVNGETAGWLILAPFPRQWLPNSPEALFLRNVNRATLLSALVATVLALSLGSLLAFTLTRSLRELTEATVQIAKGKLGLQVKIRSKDELGELAASFNKMSLDLARATQARRQMTADIAHDLRTPLSVISGYAEALNDGKLPGSPEVYNILYQEAQHLSRLVEDLRLLSLADAGELTLNLQAVSPRALLERLVSRHAVSAQQNEVTLRLEAEPDLPPARMDAERMTQVLDNLITNAFRYTPRGGEIVLSAKAVGTGVVFRVRDTGSGIAPEDLPHIFDRFYRGDKSRSQNGESGLGLAIAKSIVEAHGGSITAESAPGQGTTITIFLP